MSRTHFDPTGVRTDATLAQFKEVLTKYSVPTYSSSAPQSSAVSSDRRQTLWFHIFMKPNQHFDFAYVDMHWRAWTGLSDFSLAVLIDEFSCLFYEACFYDSLWIKKTSVSSEWKRLFQFCWCFLWIALRLWPITCLQYLINHSVLTVMQYLTVIFLVFTFFISKDIYKEPVKVLYWPSFWFSIPLFCFKILPDCYNINKIFHTIYCILWEHTYWEHCVGESQTNNK